MYRIENKYIQHIRVMPLSKPSYNLNKWFCFANNHRLFKIENITFNTSAEHFLLFVISHTHTHINGI